MYCHLCFLHGVRGIFQRPCAYDRIIISSICLINIIFRIILELYQHIITINYTNVLFPIWTLKLAIFPARNRKWREVFQPEVAPKSFPAPRHPLSTSNYNPVAKRIRYAIDFQQIWKRFSIFNLLSFNPRGKDCISLTCWSVSVCVAS